MAARAQAALTAAAAAWVLSGCVLLPGGDEGLGGETFSGRLAVQVAASSTQPAHSLNAGFELRGSPDSGRLDLSTPIGTVLARALWSPTRVVLATPRGETHYVDLDALTREVVGESLPVAALFDWLNGRPWPGAPSTPSVPGPGFEQLGWKVDLARFDDALLTARREAPPPVTVRIKLDRP